MDEHRAEEFSNEVNERGVITQTLEGRLSPDAQLGVLLRACRPVTFTPEDGK